MGREEELATLTGLLAEARLVTVTGPGGVGKTRVALRVAASIAGRFTDGVCLVDLAGLRDPQLVPGTVAACLGLPESQGREQLEAVLAYLADRQLLLILDPAEHVVAACASLADAVLRRTRQVVLLVTSRQPLDVPGEHACQILPLPVPSPDTPEAGRGDAVELFAQRARATVPGFAVTEANRGDVIRLCRRLDGIPLAIELAAVRLRAVPLAQLAQWLEDRFDLLTGSQRAVVPHHQTLRTATEWSYTLCSPAEQQLWARLSVFAGSFDLAAAESVCPDGRLGRQQVLDALVGLVNKSVILRAGDGSSRYWLLDTIREFGAERLAKAGGQQALRARHIAYYLTLARDFGSQAKSDDQLHRFGELHRQQDNIRCALEYALAEPSMDRQAAELARNLRAYWEISGLLREGRYWLTRVLSRFGDPSRERAWLLLTRGVLATLQGEPAAAVRDLRECVPVADQHGEALAQALGHAYLCLAYVFSGRHREAAAEGVTAGEQLEALDDFGGLVSLDIHLGYLCLLSGDLQGAVDRCASGLGRLGESRETWARSYLLLITGTALLFQGNATASAAACGKALELKHELGDAVGIAYCLEALALLAGQQQRHRRAAWLLGAAHTLWEQAGRRLGGTEIMEQLHEGAALAARTALGADACASIWSLAARLPLGEVLALAASDADGPVPVNAAAAGERLTRREHEIAVLVSEGLTNRQIADRLVISRRTVDSHLEHIRAKLAVTTRTEIGGQLRSAQSPAQDR
ncbi:MAG TPA: LuxR C-terminal-related transcriptional regulator [Trebonia sp.]|nr:LuxR C-terminal-related transcriptional regulator [Trebonia sp.]